MTSRFVWASLVVLAAATAVADEPVLEFHRVHVPAGRLGDVRLDGGRYVPMPLAEFDAAVARARAGDAVEPVSLATAARWTAAIDDSGALVGTVSCDVGGNASGPGRVLPLGDLVATRAVIVSDPPQEAVVCGAGGGLAVATPRPGTYEIEFARGPVAERAATYRLPLVPALVTSIELDLPPGQRPVLSGAAARHAVVTPPDDGDTMWRVGLGPAAEIGISIESEAPAPGVAVWADIALSRSRAALAAALVPAGPWRGGRLVLEQDPALRLTDVRAADDDERLDHETTADGRAVAIMVPRWLEGRRTPIVVRGAVPATGSAWALPLVRVAAASWAGGGVVVRLDPLLAARNVELTDFRVVPPETAAAWPRPPVATGMDGGESEWPTTYVLEQQGPAAACRIEVGDRQATLDVARVTTVEITPGSVLGRAACDVRVAGGEAFQIAARVASGWIIDSVDALDWSAAMDDAEPGGSAAPRGAVPADRLLDWSVVRSPAGDTLRIGLTAAVNPRRGIGLRITGHRAGLAPGASFTTADIDMVRFDGESADAAVIDLRTGPDAYVEIGGRPAGWFAVGDRLGPLVDAGPARGRIRGGDRASDLEARVVRRPPPLDVAVDIHLEPRADALVQTFTFDCRAAGGIESLVVDFAEPGGVGLTWRVESPAGIEAVARPLDAAEGGLASRSDAIADSWLVELSPPPTGPVRLRAVRSVPFTEPVPVPLAWIEAAAEPGGTVVVAAAAGARPRLVNHRLRELPTDAASAPAQAEFAFDAPLPGAAAELMPVARGVDAWAWAWRETISAWCDESGAVECESRFDVENEGRGSVTLALAAGRRLESVLVGGVRPPGVEFGPAGGTWRIPLPSGERRVEIVVRTVVAGRPGRGAWRVDPAACSLDLPVLDRDVRLLLPPGLVTASAAETPAASGTPSWLTRLTGLGAATDAEHCTAATGFRCVPVVAARDRGVLVVRRSRLAGAAVIAACGMALVVFLRGGRRATTAGWLLPLATAVAALWVPVAFVPVARAAWWGALVGMACAWCRTGVRLPRWRAARAAAAVGCVVAFIAQSLPVAAAEPGFRVFVTPGAGGDTALVPEPLFRSLAGFAVPESAAIRVLACRGTVDSAAPDAGWRFAIDVDADAGGALVLDAGPGARWLAGPSAAPIRTVIAGREVRLSAVEPGRQTVNLTLVPATERTGPVETVTAWIPVAPVATLDVAAEVAAGGVVCERATGDGPFRRAAVAADGLDARTFDVSVADRVRLVRTVDPADNLATSLRAADTVDDLSWDLDGCRIEAVTTLDAGPDLLRSVVVSVDPRLVELAATDGSGSPPRLVPLGADRTLVEFAEPVRGRVEVRLSARLPLADPVGVFDVPGIWLDGVPAETRTIRLAAAAGLDAVIDPPPAAGATAAELVGRSPARLVVRRSRQQIRGEQTLAVSFAPNGIGLSLQAEFDTGALSLVRIPIDVPVGCIVDHVALTTNATEPHEEVDAIWTRTAADGVVLLVQRPRPGRCRLEVEARLARRPAPRGRLPVVRARLGSTVPLVVSWTAVPPLTAAVDGSDEDARSGTVELADGRPEPDYALSTLADADTVAQPVAPPTTGERASRVERTEIRAAFDGRGRMHGLARFDVVTTEPSVRLRLPPGMRLFDALVDGRAAAAEPRAADVWDVPLGTASWPRAILVVFAGDAGPGLFDGGAVAVVPPRLEGLPAAEVLWSVRPPPGFGFTVAPPARPLDAGTRAVALERIATAFDRVSAEAVGPARARLAALATLRRAERGPAAEEGWWRSGTWDAAQADFVTDDATAPLVLRAVPVPDGTVAARGLATLALVAIGGLVWVASRRRSPAGDSPLR